MTFGKRILKILVIFIVVLSGLIIGVEHKNFNSFILYVKEKDITPTQVVVLVPTALVSLEHCAIKSNSHVSLTDVASYDNNRKPAKKISEKLGELGAYCAKDKGIVDKNGRAVYIFYPRTCWGNPPLNYQEQIQNERNLLEKLEKSYTLIPIQCDPTIP